MNFQTSEKPDLKMFVHFLIDFMEKKTFGSHYSAIFRWYHFFMHF